MFQNRYTAPSLDASPLTQLCGGPSPELARSLLSSANQEAKFGMGLTENSPPRAEGKQDMRNLVQATFVALEEAHLGECVLELRDRVFARHPSLLLDVHTESGVCHWSFKPMVELLLRHVLDLTKATTVPVHERRGEIAAAVELAGF
jgi:hypothetical protein